MSPILLFFVYFRIPFKPQDDIGSSIDVYKRQDNTPLKEMIARLVDEEKLRRSPIDFGLVTVRYPSLQAVELTKAQIPEGRIKDYLIATASCFPAFPVYEFDGQQYICLLYTSVRTANASSLHTTKR